MRKTSTFVFVFRSNGSSKNCRRRSQQPRFYSEAAPGCLQLRHSQLFATPGSSHWTGTPPHIDFKIFAKQGAKFNHINWEKEAKNLFQQALNSNSSTIVLNMDVIMNSLTVAP